MAALTRRFLAEGHLIDSGLLTRMLNLIVDAGADYEIIGLLHGQGPHRHVAPGDRGEVRRERRSSPPSPACW